MEEEGSSKAAGANKTKKDLNLYNWPGEDEESKWRHVTDYVVLRSDDKAGNDARVIDLMDVNTELHPNAVFILRCLFG